MKPTIRMMPALAAAALLAAAAPAVAQDRAAASYPSKPIRMVVPFSAGGGTDLVGRLLAKEMTDLLGQTVLLDNRTGAGGQIGIEIVARANPDGLCQGTPR